MAYFALVLTGGSSRKYILAAFSTVPDSSAYGGPNVTQLKGPLLFCLHEY